MVPNMLCSIDFYKHLFDHFNQPSLTTVRGQIRIIVVLIRRDRNFHCKNTRVIPPVRYAIVAINKCFFSTLLAHSSSSSFILEQFFFDWG